VEYFVNKGIRGFIARSWQFFHVFSHFAVLISPVKSVVTSKGLAHALEAAATMEMGFLRSPVTDLLSNFYAKMSGKKPSETK